MAEPTSTKNLIEEIIELRKVPTSLRSLARAQLMEMEQAELVHRRDELLASGEPKTNEPTAVL